MDDDWGPGTFLDPNAVRVKRKGEIDSDDDDDDDQHKEDPVSRLSLSLSLSLAALSRLSFDSLSIASHLGHP